MNYLGDSTLWAQQPSALVEIAHPFQLESTLGKSRIDTAALKGSFIFELARKKILGFSKLGKGWGPDRGEKISSENIQSALRAVAVLEEFSDQVWIPSRVFPAPGSDGSIGIEIEYKEKELMISFEINGNVGIFRETQKGSEEHEKSHREFDVAEELAWLFS